MRQALIVLLTIIATAVVTAGAVLLALDPSRLPVTVSAFGPRVSAPATGTGDSLRSSPVAPGPNGATDRERSEQSVSAPASVPVTPHGLLAALEVRGTGVPNALPDHVPDGIEDGATDRERSEQSVSASASAPASVSVSAPPIDFVQLTSDLDDLSTKLERFNRKLLEVIAQAEAQEASKAEASPEDPEPTEDEADS